MSKQMSFAAAMKDYFGPQPGGNSIGFLQELKALTPDDKKWFRENLPSVGYEIIDSVAA